MKEYAFDDAVIKLLILLKAVLYAGCLGVMYGSAVLIQRFLCFSLRGKSTGKELMKGHRC